MRIYFFAVKIWIPLETLSHNDILSLNSAIGEIYAARDLESFYRSVFSSVQEIIPSETTSFNDTILNPAPRLLNSINASQYHSNVVNKLLPVLNAHIHEHPFVPHILSDNVIKTTDFVTMSQFKGLAIYNEYYRHLDVETQINLTIPVSQDKARIFTLSRKDPDFSEMDRLILTLLRPHLINAFRNVTELSRIRLERDLLQKCAESETQGAILLQSDGTMLCISPFAREMIKRYFDAALVEGDTLPDILLQWFRVEANPPSPSFAKGGNLKSPTLKKGDSGGFSKRVEREPLTVEKGDRCLKIKLLKDFITGDYMLVMTEKDGSSILQNLQGYGLSCREAEVLMWLSKGKTNVEIAIILVISKRTVEKHLEHILVKLGVETRAAAAAVINLG